MKPGAAAGAFLKNVSRRTTVGSVKPRTAARTIISHGAPRLPRRSTVGYPVQPGITIAGADVSARKALPGTGRRTAIASDAVGAIATAHYAVSGGVP